MKRRPARLVEIIDRHTRDLKYLNVHDHDVTRAPNLNLPNNQSRLGLKLINISIHKWAYIVIGVMMPPPPASPSNVV